MLLLDYIDRLGVQAVLGRPVLYAREIRCMIFAQNVVKWHNERAAHPSAATWSLENPEKSQVLAVAGNAYIEMFNA